MPCLSPGSYLSGRPLGPRLTGAAALTACAALQIARSEFLRALRQKYALSCVFASFLLESSMRAQTDLVDQFF